MKRTALVLILLVAAISSHAADVKLSSIFSDNMVLQRGAKVPVWGTAEAGEEISVTFDKQTVKATTDKDGKWKAELEPLEPGGPFELKAAGKDAVAVKNVLVGDV